MRKCSRTISSEQLEEIKEKMRKCPRCGTTNGHHLFDCPFVGPDAIDPNIFVPDAKAFRAETTGRSVGVCEYCGHELDETDPNPTTDGTPLICKECWEI